MTQTFAPSPGAAPFSTMVAAQARMESRLLLRNGEQLLIAIVIPVLVLVGAVVGADHLHALRTERAIDVFAPGVLGLAVMSTSFTSLAIATGFERRYGVLKWLGTSPLPRSGLLLGKIGGLLVVEVLQIVVLGSVALAMGWHPALGVASVLGILAMLLLGTAAFASLGLFVAGVFRAEATLAVANLVYLLLLAGGGVVLPVRWYGGFGPVASLLPSGALGEGLRFAALGEGFPALQVGVLVVWAGIGTLLTARTFSWE